MQFENDLAFAIELDNTDPLKDFRNCFTIPARNGKEQIYFLGNSLGLQPKSTQSFIQKILNHWSDYGVEGFFTGPDPWYDYHDQLVEPLSKIVGARPKEVVVMNQLTVNLHLMMASFYQPQKKRKKIICESNAFPSDQYMLETFLRFQGLDPQKEIIEVFPRKNEYNIRTEDILEKIYQYQDEIALVFWGAVNYYTGQFFNLKEITRAAHKVGAIAGFDLAHATGNVKLDLHEWDVDFGCWCSYKYLNSGPGAVAGSFIHERYHNDDSFPRLAGWWGYDKSTRFQMRKGFVPMNSAEGWQLSTPSMILFAMLKASLEIFEQAGMQKILEKSTMMSNYIFYLLREIIKLLPDEYLKILTPFNENERGSQVSISITNKGREVFEALSNQGIFADWREPDVIRIAPVALYNKFEEVWRFIHILKNLLVAREC